MTGWDEKGSCADTIFTVLLIFSTLLFPIIMIDYVIRQQIKYNGAQLKHRYKICGRQTI